MKNPFSGMISRPLEWCHDKKTDIKYGCVHAIDTVKYMWDHSGPIKPIVLFVGRGLRSGANGFWALQKRCSFDVDELGDRKFNPKKSAGFWGASVATVGVLYFGAGPAARTLVGAFSYACADEYTFNFSKAAFNKDANVLQVRYSDGSGVRKGLDNAFTADIPDNPFLSLVNIFSDGYDPESRAGASFQKDTQICTARMTRPKSMHIFGHEIRPKLYGSPVCYDDPSHAPAIYGKVSPQ